MPIGSFLDFVNFLGCLCVGGFPLILEMRSLGLGDRSFVVRVSCSSINASAAGFFAEFLALPGSCVI